MVLEGIKVAIFKQLFYVKSWNKTLNRENWQKKCENLATLFDLFDR